MSIATEIARLQQAKADLKTSINAKGGTITDETIDEYASKVSALPSPKEEQTKTVSPTTSSQDVLPDTNKVLSKVTVNAIPTETKSQQPNLSSGNQTINATSGKFMTSFTITKDTVNHISANIKAGKTIYGVTGKTEVVDTTEAVAPASAGDILINKIGFVNGTKITGSMPNNSSGSANITTKAQSINLNAGYYDGTGVIKISQTEQDKIISENIRIGVSILGVDGGLVENLGVTVWGYE